MFVEAVVDDYGENDALQWLEIQLLLACNLFVFSLDDAGSSIMKGYAR